MKLITKWIYNYAKGQQHSLVSCDYIIEKDCLIFAFTSGSIRMKSVILKLDLKTQECQILFEENHVIRTAGILDNGRDYFTSMKSRAYCILESGEKIWETTVGKGNPSFKMALDEKCFYVSNCTIFCLDKQSGEILWKNEKYQKKTNCNILLHDKYLYCGEQGGKIFCLDRSTGEPIWDFGENEWISNIEVLPGHRLLVNHCSGWFYILNAKTGDMIEKIQANGQIYDCLAMEENRIYVGDQNAVMHPTEGNMTCYTLTDNCSLIELFKYSTVGGVSSNILIKDNILFFGTESGYLYGIDKMNGQTLMTKKKCKGVCRNVILKDQDLIVLSDKGQVECFEFI